MSEYYNPKRTKNIYNPSDPRPFKLSRSKIDLFLECPRCFYLDRRLGIGRPPGYPFSLNSAVDFLLKREFDLHRAKKEAHPLIKAYGIDAIVVSHKNLESWRHNFVGIRYLHELTNLVIFGAIDDLWQNSSGEYIVVDYKATSKNGKISALEHKWQDGYKRQMEVYQWLLRKNGHKVSDTGYFVYCNGKTDKKAFDGKLEFDVTLIPYQGNSQWIEKKIFEIHKTLNKNEIPLPSKDCDYCAYFDAVNSVLRQNWNYGKTKK